VRHLVVDRLHRAAALLVHAAGDEEDVGVLGIAGVNDAEALQVVMRAERRHHLNVAAIAARGIIVDDPR
jgi:hypothetical protein